MKVVLHYTCFKCYGLGFFGNKYILDYKTLGIYLNYIWTNLIKVNFMLKPQIRYYQKVMKLEVGKEGMLPSTLTLRNSSYNIHSVVPLVPFML